MHILGIETSCDETAAAVLESTAPGQGVILASIVRDQLAAHAPFGGVVPEIAARAHVECLDQAIVRAFAASGIGRAAIDGIAVTAGPGLIGGLIVGLVSADAIGRALGVPVYRINHLEGHALSARLCDRVPFPYLLLLVSGGHTQIVLVRDIGRYARWGSTIDDALGEAYDKAARVLGLPFPGGPALERAACQGTPGRVGLPRPLLREPSMNMSFAGLKTAVSHRARDLGLGGGVPAGGAVSKAQSASICDLCAEFQAAVIDVLVDRLRRAFDRYRAEVAAPLRLVVAGGVATNEAIRTALKALAGEYGATWTVPPANLCRDNGAMIAWAAIERLHAGVPAGTVGSARARWPLDGDAPPLIGSGDRVKV